MSKKEIIRCLKRYIAREIYTALTSTKTPTNRLTSIGASRVPMSKGDV